MRKGSNSSAVLWALWGLSSLVAGCAPELGDACDVSTDCSVQGDRDCDTSAPGGYCTVEDCVEGACDNEGYCVRFEPDQIRLSSAWCMAECKRGCRASYRCVTVAELNAERCGIEGVAPEDTIEEYRRLVDLPSDEERCAPLPPGDPECPWNQLQVCLRTQPRAAEMLDDAEGAGFCGQRPPGDPGSEDEAASREP